MATAPVHPRNTSSPTYHDDNAHAYLHSLQQGQFPDIRPEFGRWEPAVAYFEKRLKMVSNPVGIAPHLFQSVLASGRFPGLAELLSGAPRKQPAQGEPELKRTEQGDIPGLPTYAQIPPAVVKNACPELDWYTEFSKKASDRAWPDFHPFCGLFLFSVVAGRRVYLEIKKKRFYTNLMLAQCATTSMYAKSFTANVAKQFLYELDLGYTLAPNRITPAKLLSDMAGGHVPTHFADLEPEKQERARRKLGMPGQKGLLFDELGLFIQGMLRKNSVNADFADLLMSLDECPPSYENSTIARGGEEIEKPYLTLLGNMTPANLRQNAKAGADFWHDGFWARISFVVAPPVDKDEEDPGPRQLSDLDDIELPYPPALLESLRAWHERLGIPVCHLEQKTNAKGDPVDDYIVHRGELPETACTITREAEQAWINYDHALRQLCRKLPHEDFNGSYVRLAETAMRIAVMLASLSNSNHIELKHWAKAQELTEILRRNLHELYAQVNMGEEKPSYAKTVEDKVLAYIDKFATEIEDKDKIPTIRNMSRYLKSVDVKALRSAVIDLKQVDVLEERKVGKAVYYVREGAG